MKKVRVCITWICMVLLITSLLGTSVFANSAQSQWEGTTSTGAIITDGTCPIIVEDELLTFDIQEFPEQYYRDIDEYLKYSGKVTAEYTFYNPADYTVNATLVFPFGAVPDYGFLRDDETEEIMWNADTEKYEITVNGESVSKELRHTLMFYGSNLIWKRI